MSRYATVDDLRVFGIQESATSGLAQADIERALDATSRVADTYLYGRGITVPLAEGTWGDDLRQAVAKLTAWDLIVHHRGVNPNDMGHAGLKMSADKAEAWLVRIAKGEINLVLNSPAVRSTAPLMQVFTSGEGDRGW